MNQAAVELVESNSGKLNDTSQFLTFFVSGQEYGISITEVQGIQGWDFVTAIPNSPEYILGVINLRGSIVPILDLRIRFGVKDVLYDDLTVVIVVKINTENGAKIFGFVVDAVSEVYNVSIGDLNPPPDFGSSAEMGYVRGLASIEGKMIIALDVAKLVLDVIGEQRASL